jgi:hypothetical protein
MRMQRGTPKRRIAAISSRRIVKLRLSARSRKAMHARVP